MKNGVIRPTSRVATTRTCYPVTGLLLVLRETQAKLRICHQQSPNQNDDRAEFSLFIKMTKQTKLQTNLFMKQLQCFVYFNRVYIAKDKKTTHIVQGTRILRVYIAQWQQTCFADITWSIKRKTIVTTMEDHCTKIVESVVIIFRMATSNNRMSGVLNLKLQLR